MSKRSEEARTSAAGPRDPDLDDLSQPGVESANTLPSPDEIRLRAYYRYMERQSEDGDEIGDWLAAESELSRLSEEDKRPAEGGHHDE
jgi:hypothetical protein